MKEFYAQETQSSYMSTWLLYLPVSETLQKPDAIPENLPVTLIYNNFYICKRHLVIYEIPPILFTILRDEPFWSLTTLPQELKILLF